MTTYASDLQRPEGPVALVDGSFLVVEGGRGTVTRIMPGGRSTRIIATTGEPNGLAVDRAGAIWVADVRPPALIRLGMDGRFERVLMQYRGEPFMYPNDLCFGPDGALYLTDSGFRVDELETNGIIRPDWKRLKMDGRIYRVDPKTLTMEKLDDGLYLANGLAFGPDGALYVAETVGGAIYRYAWTGGKLGPRREFGNVLTVKERDDLVGPDGMAFDANGKLYVAVAGQGDVTVLGRDGGVLERIATPGTFPTNVCFGLPGERKIYVTEYNNGHVECYDVDADGFALYG
jgi:gluconolactonase